MRRFFAYAFAALVCTSPPAVAGTGGQLPTCSPGDPVVWANANSKIFHLQGDKYYGNTKHGQYLCESKATAAGYRAAKMSAPSNAANGGNAMPGPGASPAPTSAPGAMTPAPGASPTGKHHRHHKRYASPSPWPMST